MTATMLHWHAIIYLSGVFIGLLISVGVLFWAAAPFLIQSQHDAWRSRCPWNEAGIPAGESVVRIIVGSITALLVAICLIGLLTASDQWMAAFNGPLALGYENALPPPPVTCTVDPLC